MLVRLPSALPCNLEGVKTSRHPPSRFYFTGAVVLPPIIALAGEVPLAVLVFIFLMLAGTVCAVAEPGTSETSHRKPPPDRG